MRRRVRVVSAAVVAAVATVLALGVVPASASAIGLTQSSIASPLPNGAGVPGTAPTPNIADGAVLDAEEMSNGHIVVGGNFTQVQDMATAGQPTLNRSKVFSFDPTTGKVDGGFAPAISGTVNAVWPGPSPATVYVAGAFSGVGHNLVLLDLATGTPVSGFNPPGINGAINDIEVAAGRLFIGGVFTKIGTATHGGLASLNPSTGALDPYMSIDVADHHNWTSTNGWAKAPVGVSKLDVTATGDRMAIIGNFKHVEGLARDQAAVLDLPSGTGASVTVDPWMTAKYQAPCAKAFDSYVRGVQWSPDGKYFVITATGGGGNTTSTYCDAAARFNWPDPNGTTTAGASAYWIDYTGNDTLYSVAISGSAVYVGGHERWLNNALGVDKAGAGAVPRPGVAALDPLNGLPLSWNPGRNPRGVGAQTLLLTSQVPGLYVGSDTDWIGNHKYLRKKIAFFPLSGAPLVSQDISNLSTGQVYLAGTSSTSTVTARTYDGGTGVGPDQSVANGGIPWSLTRGGVWIGGNLYYGRQNGTTWELVRQPFDGSRFGSPTFITTPYKDPVWDGVDNGSGSTYDGAFPNFYASGELGSVTGMFYWNGQLFYTKSGSSSLFSRGFSVDSGIVSARSTTVSGVSIPNASGMFINGTSLYTADTTGRLWQRSFNPTTGAIGSTASQVSGPGKDSKNWATRNLFIAPKPGTPPPNSPPTASFTAPTNCVVNTPCSFTSTSSDPDGDTLTSSWDFGDSTSPGTSATTSHTFAAAQQYDVTLTVNDGHNPPVSVDHFVTVAPASTGSGTISVVGHAGTTSGTSSGVGSLSVPLPSGIADGDGIVAAYTTNNGNIPTTPNGYSLVTTQTAPNTGTPAMTTTVFQRVAAASDSGSQLGVSLPSGQLAKAALQVVVYHGTSSSGPVVSSAGNSDGSQMQHTLPTVTFAAGQWVLGVWADKSSSVRTWTPPTGYTAEDQQDGIANGGSISGLLADQAETGSGSVTGVSASTSTASSRGVMIALVIDPAPQSNGTPQNRPPTAAFTAPTNCSVSTACSFASTSSDPDGDPLTYNWNFGDGGTSTSATPSHTFTTAQPYNVTLTVTDTHSATGSVSHQVQVSPVVTGAGISRVGATGTTSGTSRGVNSLTVTLPGGITAGDGIIVAYTSNNANQAVAPTGYTLVGTQTAPNTGTAVMTTTVFQKVAGASDSGADLTVALAPGKEAKAVLQAIVYHGTSASGPVTLFVGDSDSAQTKHDLPTASVADGQWVLGVWADKSSSARTWTAPSGYAQEDQQAGIANGGSVSGLLADKAQTGSGSVTGVFATTSTTSSRGIMITLVISPA